MCFSYNKDKKTQSIYLNCKLDSESVGKHAPLKGNAEVFISQYSNGRSLNGNIADLKMLPFGLSTKEEVFDRMIKFPLFAVLPSKVESHPLAASALAHVVHVPDSISDTSVLLSRVVDSEDDTATALLAIKAQAKKYGYIRSPDHFMREEGAPEVFCTYCSCPIEDGWRGVCGLLPCVYPRL